MIRATQVAGIALLTALAVSAPPSIPGWAALRWSDGSDAGALVEERSYTTDELAND